MKQIVGKLFSLKLLDHVVFCSKMLALSGPNIINYISICCYTSNNTSNGLIYSFICSYSRSRSNGAVGFGYNVVDLKKEELEIINIDKFILNDSIKSNFKWSRHV